MSRRRTAQIPAVSMLDLLFGTFGAVVAIAALLTLLRQQESRISSEPFFYVAARAVLPVKASRPYLSSTFITFELSSDQVPRAAFAPGPASGDALSDEATYVAQTSEDAVSASLLLSEAVLAKYRSGRLRARLHNIPSLFFDYVPPASPDLMLQVTLMIKRKDAACSREFNVELRKLDDHERALADGPPSLFSIASERNGRLICAVGNAASDVSQFEVSDGWISLH